MHVHRGNRPHECEWCGKSSSQTNDPTNHIIRHVGVKTFECKSCQYSRTESDNLKSHGDSKIYVGKQLIDGVIAGGSMW